MRLLADRPHLPANQAKKARRDYATDSSTSSFSPMPNSNGAKIVRRPKPNDLSRSQIHAKIKNHKLEKEQAFQTKLDAASAKKKAQALKEATTTKVEVTPEGEPFGDVKKNDPKDPGTKEKLKDALTAGAFNFSAKEREVLGKILKDQ